MPALAALASQIRSKNAGPLKLTIDIFFDESDAYERVRDSGVVTTETVAEQYNIPEADVLGVYMVDRVDAIKITIKRPTPAGSIDDTDIYGTQQHGPIVDLEI